MARPLRIEYPGAFYHVTSRGNERKDIFKSNTDREMFLSYLASAQEKYEAVVHAYCLMSNHYHLMIETPQGNLSQIMKYINSSYTNFFNIKRKRTGHLLQGRYKAVLVEADAYATELSRYIHLNPVRAGMVRSPEEYRWSSYSYYTERSSPSWLKTGFILGYFGTDPTQSRRDYRNYVIEKVNGGYIDPLAGVVASTILGSEDFVRRIKENELDGRTLDRDLPALKELKEKPDPKMIEDAALKIFSEDKRTARFAGIYLCHRYSAAKLREIGCLYRLSDSGVTQARRRFEAAMKVDAPLRKKIEEVLVILGL